MLSLFRHSEEANIEMILAQHAVTAGACAAADGGVSTERQFRDLLEALPAAIYTTDADGRITFFNQHASGLPAAPQNSARCGA
jgi:PAS domain-containing protein